MLVVVVSVQVIVIDVKVHNMVALRLLGGLATASIIMCTAAVKVAVTVS